MPRPKEGYRNAAGQKIPGVSDITGRFMNRARLLYWAFNRGKAGHPKLYDDTDLNIGTAVHMMAELDLKEQPQADIDFYAETTLPDLEMRKKAESAFSAFRQWRSDFHVVPIEQEVSLISEKLQFGGTLDTVALVRNGFALIDFKTSTSGEVYADHLLQLAAYGILWTEAHPKEELAAGYHLILLPKDGGEPIHRRYSHDQLHPFRQQFWLYRQAFERDALCNDPKVLAGSAVAPSPAPVPAPPRRQSAKRATKQPAAAPATMGEMLRSYGHVRVA